MNFSKLVFDSQARAGVFLNNWPAAADEGGPLVPVVGLEKAELFSDEEPVTRLAKALACLPLTTRGSVAGFFGECQAYFARLHGALEVAYDPTVAPDRGSALLFKGLNAVFQDPLLLHRAPEAHDAASYILTVDVLEAIAQSPNPVPRHVIAALFRQENRPLVLPDTEHFSTWRHMVLEQAGFVPIQGKAFGYFHMLAQWQSGLDRVMQPV